MIVVCPECSKRYQVEDNLLHKQGRRVRCAACGRVWHQKSDVVSTLENNPLVQGLQDVTAEEKDAQAKTWSRWGWGTFSISVLALVGFFLVGSGYLSYHFPQVQRLYSLIGWSLNDPGQGLAITNTKIEAAENGQFIVKGDVLNTSDNVQSVRGLHLKVLGETGCDTPSADGDCILKEWKLNLDDDSLLPGEQLHFESKPYPIVQGAKRVTVSF